MFLDRLESGFLLFETRQGLVRVELSLWQRVYLIWTFRHFRQLSIPLLNPRQRALVDSLFHNGVGGVSHSYQRASVIGMVENYVPPPVPAEVSVETPVEVPIKARIDASPSPRLDDERQTEEIGQPAETASEAKLAPSSWPTLAWSKLVASRLAKTTRAPYKLATSRAVPIIAAISLCVVSVVAWHRIHAIPASQANTQPQLQRINAIALPNEATSARPTITAEPIAQKPSLMASPGVTPEALDAVAPPPTPAAMPGNVPTVISTPIPLAELPTAKRVIRVHDPELPRNPPLHDLPGNESRIQASRPPLRFAYPIYPDVRARGVVSLTAEVDSEGVVLSVKIVSGNPALAAAAVRAIRQWRYRPYVKDGRPVATETNIVISFFADDAISMKFPPSIAATQ